MNKQFLMIPLLALTLSACTPQEPAEPEATTPTSFPPDSPFAAQQSMQAAGQAFIEDFFASAPPTSDPQAKQRAYAALTADTQERLDIDVEAANLAQFVGIQDIPDGGYTFEDLRMDSDTQGALTIAMEYSGSGQAVRILNMIVEDGIWKVDSITNPRPQ